MSTTETIIAVFVLAAIVGQAWLVSSGKRRIDRQIRQLQADTAAKKAKLIEDEFDNQTGDRK